MLAKIPTALVLIPSKSRSRQSRNRIPKRIHDVNINVRTASVARVAQSRFMGLRRLQALRLTAIPWITWLALAKLARVTAGPQYILTLDTTADDYPESTKLLFES
jgi:hypothetical protein